MFPLLEVKTLKAKVPTWSVHLTISSNAENSLFSLSHFPLEVVKYHQLTALKQHTLITYLLGVPELRNGSLDLILMLGEMLNFCHAGFAGWSLEFYSQHCIVPTADTIPKQRAESNPKALLGIAPNFPITFWKRKTKKLEWRDSAIDPFLVYG